MMSSHFCKHKKNTYIYYWTKKLNQQHTGGQLINHKVTQGGVTVWLKRTWLILRLRMNCFTVFYFLINLSEITPFPTAKQKKKKTAVLRFNTYWSAVQHSRFRLRFVNLDHTGILHHSLQLDADLKLLLKVSHWQKQQETEYRWKKNPKKIKKTPTNIQQKWSVL